MQVKAFKDYDETYEINAGYKYLKEFGEAQRGIKGDMLSSFASLLGAESLFAEGFNKSGCLNRL